MSTTHAMHATHVNAPPGHPTPAHATAPERSTT